MFSVFHAGNKWRNLAPVKKSAKTHSSQQDKLNNASLSERNLPNEIASSFKTSSVFFPLLWSVFRSDACGETVARVNRGSLWCFHTRVVPLHLVTRLWVQSHEFVLNSCLDQKMVNLIQTNRTKPFHVCQCCKQSSSKWFLQVYALGFDRVG